MLRDLLVRLRGRQTARHTVHHEVEVKLSVPAEGQDPEAVAKEIEAEVARQLAESNDPAAAKAALDEIAERHGGKLDEFKER